MTDVAMIAEIVRRATAAGPARILDAAGAEVHEIPFPLGRVSNDLADTQAVLAIVDGALVARAARPEGDAAFKALPNQDIERALHEAMRTFVALSESPEGFLDAEGRTLRSHGAILYPPGFDGPPGSVRIDRRRRDRNRLLALAAVCGVVVVAALCGAGLADPAVLLLAPGPLLYAWALLRANGAARDIEAVEPAWNEHLGRARAQARSIAAIANRARGLGA